MTRGIGLAGHGRWLSASTAASQVCTPARPRRPVCIAVDMAVSPEKVDLLTDLAKRFNDSDRANVDDECIFVRVQRRSRRARARRSLAEDWPDPKANGPRPVVWSPAASAWGEVVNQRRADQGKNAIAPAGKPFMLTPLVIAMPAADGGGARVSRHADRLRRHPAPRQRPGGLGRLRTPRVGPVPARQDQPQLLDQRAERHDRPVLRGRRARRAGSRSRTSTGPTSTSSPASIESSVVHYGDTTLTFLNNLYRADRRGTGLTYVSAVAVEEKSVIDYNKGNPDGILDPGEKPKPPRVPLVAIYPKEGTLFSDNPFFMLDAPWVSAKEKKAAAKFEQFVQQPANQKRVLRFGFRPGNPQVAIGDADRREERRRSQPAPDDGSSCRRRRCSSGLIDRWGQNRKAARVLMVIDVSGSMGEPAGGEGGPTKLDLAKQAAVNALDQFKPEDDVGLWIFSTEISRTEPDRLPRARADRAHRRAARGASPAKIHDLVPTQGTPLYTVTKAADDRLVEHVRRAPDQRGAAAHRRARTRTTATTTSTGCSARCGRATRARSSRPGAGLPDRVRPGRRPRARSSASPRRPTPPSTTPSTRRPSSKVFLAVVSNF